MRHQIIEYLKFIKSSTNQHGVHSPFVFKLVTECFYKKKHDKSYHLLNKYRQHLFKNHNTINITDFGAGSKVFKTNRREISKIAKNAGISLKYAKLLFRLVQYVNAKNILELGTSLGMASSAMAYAKPNANIITVEGCPETANIANIHFKKFNLNNIQLKVCTFDSALKDSQNKSFDIILIDGNHQKDATIKYFNAVLPMTHNDTIIILDDIHWSKGMTVAWNTIKTHPKVSITIDTFFWGLVFLRKEQAKEDFTIRL